MNELKTIITYIPPRIHYSDLKLSGDGLLPKNLYLASSTLPDPSGKVLFRGRKRKSCILVPANDPGFGPGTLRTLNAVQVL